MQWVANFCEGQSREASLPDQLKLVCLGFRCHPPPDPSDTQLNSYFHLQSLAQVTPSVVAGSGAGSKLQAVACLLYLAV